MSSTTVPIQQSAGTITQTPNVQVTSLGASQDTLNKRQQKAQRKKVQDTYAKGPDALQGGQLIGAVEEEKRGRGASYLARFDLGKEVAVTEVDEPEDEGDNEDEEGVSNTDEKEASDNLDDEEDFDDQLPEEDDDQDDEEEDEDEPAPGRK